MNVSQLKSVMQKYKRAWENQDSNLILECFIKTGVYQESPLAKPYRGHNQIKKFWNRVVKKNTKHIQFKLRKCYVSNDGKTGFAEWDCKNIYLGQKHHMAGIMILKMKGNQISYLNEYWNTQRNG